MNSPNARGRLTLDPENARWLGVCAGIARWLDLPIALVRVVFVICVITWPTLLLAYVIAYFVLDRGITADSVQGYFRGPETAEHFRQLNYRKPLYRNPSKGYLGGVCAGLANYLEVGTFWVRFATVTSLLVFGPFTLLGYVVCWIAIDVDPRETPCMSRRQRRKQQRKAAKWEARREAGRENQDDQRQQPPHAEQRAAQSEEARHTPPTEDQCVDTFRKLELRLREIEAYMTSKRFRLHCEINRI